MANNCLQLNEDKTESIIFSKQQDLKSVSHRTVSLGNEKELPSTKVQNIGAICPGAMIDSSLAILSHRNSAAKSCYIQIIDLAEK